MFAAVWPRREALTSHLPLFATFNNVAGLPLSLPLTIRATSSIVQSSAGMHLRGPEQQNVRLSTYGTDSVCTDYHTYEYTYYDLSSY